MRANRFRNALIEMGILPDIPSRGGCKAPVGHDADLSRLHHYIETMFAGLKHRRRIATRYERCPASPLVLVATVMFWICDPSLGKPTAPLICLQD